MTQLEQNFFEAATRWFRKPEPVDIDWEQRRYEIAKVALVSLISDPNMADCEIPSAAVYYADALIKELKK